MLKSLRRLYGHMEWADRRTLDSLRTAADPPGAAVELFAHVLGTEHRWLTRLTGDEPRVAVWPEATIEACEPLVETNTAEFRLLLEESEPDGLSRVVRYTNSAGEDFASRVDDILLHVVLHGMYHRGQVAMVLRQQEIPPSPTDYIAWVRGAPAATRSPRSAL